MSIEPSATNGRVEAGATTDRTGSPAAAMGKRPAAAQDPLRAYSRALRAHAAQVCSRSSELCAHSELLTSAMRQARGALARALGDD